MFKYRTKPYTIDEVELLLDYSKDVPVTNVGLLRSKEQQEKYEQFKKENINPDNFIKKNLLKNELDKKSFIFTENDFPYYLPDSSKHLLLWSQNPLNSKTITDLTKNKLGDDSKFLFFENSDYNKTIKKVVHYHIITY